MNCKYIYDEAHQGYDFTIYTHEDNMCTVDVKHPCGELEAGWVHIESFDMAKELAKTYIYSLNAGKMFRSKPHCNNEYCIEAHRDS